MIEPEPIQPVDRTYVRLRGRKLSYFSGCDYFRLASHPAVIKAAHDGLRKSGLNVAASRLTTGNRRIYPLLEKALEDFFDAEAALLLPGGYLTSLAVAQTLTGHYSHTLLDERAHPGLLDAAALFDCPVFRFRHRDPEDFRRTVTRCGPGARPVVLTDGMFWHDGAVAPLKAYLECLPADGLIIVDDAHGAGLLGHSGRGTPELEGVGRERIVQCITLSKAFGVYGGAVLGSEELREKMLSRSRLFIGSTPLPPPLAHAALASVKILKSDKSLRRRLDQNTTHVKSALRKAGFVLPETPGPIVSLESPADEREAALMKHRLTSAGIYPPFVKYPGGPEHGCFRFVISSEHSRKQLDRLVKALITARDSSGE